MLNHKKKSTPMFSALQLLLNTVNISLSSHEFEYLNNF